MSQLRPTGAGGCRLRPADFSTLKEALEYAARSRAGFNFYSARAELLSVLSYRDLRDQAESLARRMLRAGLRPGQRIAMIAETSADFVRAFFASQYAALVPVPLPPPAAFAGRVSYVEHIRPMLASARPSAVLAPEVFLESVRHATAGLGVGLIGTFADLERMPEEGADLPPVRQEAVCYLQFSSGSTRSPTGVSVTHRALLANSRGIVCHGLKVREGDRCTSWLPFYHDMGLVGFLLVPLTAQISTDYLAPDGFARRPLLWPTLISLNGGTLSYSPSFGYDLCARRGRNADLSHLDLSRWRAAGIGGDVIRPGILARFADTFGTCGFRKQSFVASYGMAEATLGVSFAPLGRGLEVDRVDLGRLRREGRATPADGDNVRELVFCGERLPGHELEIRSAEGAVLEERAVGRIMVRGPSVMSEYFGRSEETARVLSSDGWLDTGDLGYLVGESLVVAGRSKDLILVNGRNVWPEDLELAVEHQIEGVRQADVVAFSVDEQEAERVVLLVQCRSLDAAAREALRRGVAEVVLARAGLNCEVVLVSHNALPRTSSGKLSRMRARDMYLASLLGESPPNLAPTGLAGEYAPEIPVPRSS
ncbi:MAG TPA: fatty acyl-AMP ligase [Steroidobacteraceae bacterium]|nr:fatty acyl-AMP ligase [Steroidobacteraceae bacterium]